MRACSAARSNALSLIVAIFAAVAVFCVNVIMVI